MKPVIAPIKSGDSGPSVTNLQEILQSLIERQLFKTLDAPNRPTLEELQKLTQLLKDERSQSLFGEASQQLVRYFQIQQGLGDSLNGVVEDKTAARLNEILKSLGLLDTEPVFVVRGNVRDSTGKPAANVIVRAFDMDLRSEQLLGEMKSGRDGGYEILYSADSFRRAEKGSADLLVKAFNQDGMLLVTAGVLFNAPSLAELDLVIPAGAGQLPTLFERIAALLPPLLEDLKVEALEEDGQHQDLSFLSGETGLEKQDLARFVLAQRLAKPALQPEFWFVLLGGSIFRYAENQSLALQLVAILEMLPALDAAAVSKQFSRAFNQQEIPEVLRKNVPGWIEAFLGFVAARSVNGEAGPTFVKLALEHAGIEGAEKQEKFARLLNRYRPFSLEFTAALEQDPSFKKEEIADLHSSYRLAEVTRGDFSVVKMLKEEFGVRQPEKIRTLAKMSQNEWVSLIAKKFAAGEIELPIQVDKIAGQVEFPQAEVYGKALERQFREAFPSTAFAGGVERALQNGGARGVKHAELLGKFLERHESFELLQTPIDEFFSNNPGSDDGELAKDGGFRLELKAIQRLFKLVPTFEATDALLADGLHSAQQVYRMGESEFVGRYGDRPGFSAESARLAWNRAADTHAAVLTIVSDLKAFEEGSLPLALKNGNKALAAFPGWDGLFQSGGLCDCEPCRSVLSPAAYFADLLMFLRDRRAGTSSVKDVLFRRRPDLGYLELNCDNALIPLPYIDVVCEVLEDAVAAGANDLELQGLNALMPADPENSKRKVRSLFLQYQISLGADFSLLQVDPSDPDRWVAHGDDVTYLLKKKTTPDFFAEILRNTKAGADELRAYPQYVNPKAYEKLRAAKYPFKLPFDLFAEEVRAAFRKTNLRRWDLMRTLRGAGTPSNSSDKEVATEYFSISADPAAAFDEQTLILKDDATVAGQQEIWGETGNAGWLNRVGTVKYFIQKTGLDYSELLALLDLKFINPRGDIAINYSDDPGCDTSRQFIQILDPKKLDRIHRFLRIWRKLRGWEMWELDLVIRQPAIGRGMIDETFLINLFYFCELKNRLGGSATVEQTLALFGDLNVETHFSGVNRKRADGLYQQLFLNSKLIQPLDSAFDVARVNLPGPTTEKIATHQIAVSAALGVREADLLLLKALSKPDKTPYISDDLTLANLSFLWRQAWLSRLLKFKAQEWQSLLKIRNGNILQFAGPKAALEFVENIELIKTTGFTTDELNWLLAADRSAKAATKESETARFLLGLRRQLQAIRAENDPVQYDFLTAATPANEEQLTTLLSSLLQKLNRDEGGVRLFLAALAGRVLLKSEVRGLPLGFTFPAVVTAAPNHIPIQYDEPNKLIRFTGLMSDDQRLTLLTDASLTALAGNPDYATAIGELHRQSLAAPTMYLTTEVKAVLAGGVTLPVEYPSLPLRYNPTTQMLAFIGVMTDAERLALTASAAYPAGVIDELFRSPRLAVKFYEPVFTAALAMLPPAIDFKQQLPADLAARIAYDAEQGLLRFTGIMSKDEQAALAALLPNLLPAGTAYQAAVNSLAAQPETIALPDERIWLTSSDLDTTLPANDTLAKRLANAAGKALGYLSKTLAANAVVQLGSAQLGLTEMLTRRLVSDYDLLPETLLAHLSGAFAATTGGVDYDALKITFDGWFWASRVAAIWKKWKISPQELDKLTALMTGAQLIDFLTLPLDDSATTASLEKLLRTGRLLKMRDNLSETGITLLEVLEKLNRGAYAAAAAAGNPAASAAQLLAIEKRLFASDVQRLNGSWLSSDVEQLTLSLDLAYPADYLLAESWERLRRAFYFFDNLNAGVNAVKAFADSAMTVAHAKTIKELLRSKFGAETWLALSAEIQDDLRERKRDALAAYLLTRPKPADAPSGKWENTNDLYAYYLLDVEMGACQLTSRLVQASGSVQLFVQRCFMGLEPEVVVQADGATGDSAWRWWKWMRKYRVWEANRKIFLWPENWIEPELKRDRSPFFKEMENELLQNEVTQENAQTALLNYLDKLDSVAQLEIAGFFQEDNGDNSVIHVFGRTPGAEPHRYYYRRYDYRQWTPWEKVELDIQGDYLIPAVVNSQLYLYWPVFTEVPDESGNNTVRVPAPGQTSFTPDKTKKKLRLQMAVSQYRQGQWTAKKVSKDFDESQPYEGEIAKKHYTFFPMDKSRAGGRFTIKYQGYSLDADASSRANQSVMEAPWSAVKAGLYGEVDLSGCKGAQDLTFLPWDFKYVYPASRPESDSTGNRAVYSKWVERNFRHDSPQNDFTIDNAYAGLPASLRYAPVLMQTPEIFKVSPAWHFSYMDKLGLELESSYDTAGTWLPFFYNDQKRTFLVLPATDAGSSIGQNYYPGIRSILNSWENYFNGQVQTWADVLVGMLTQDERDDLIAWFVWNKHVALQPPYSDAQFKDLILQFPLASAGHYLRILSQEYFQFQQFRFGNFYHPFLCDFSRLAYNPLEGLPALMSRETQLKNSGFSFRQSYQPTRLVVEPSTEEFFPKEVVDFSLDGAYSSYNWELFFHAPLLIANALSKNQRFEEARDWYHFIFNPLGVAAARPGGSALSKYWITKPFFETTDPQYLQQRIDNILRILAGDRNAPGFAQARGAIAQAVYDWRTNPFEPHRIANYRTVAYQKTVVMKYLDNLVAWGDFLFRQDSMESVSEATQLYIMAAEILGPRPKVIPPAAKPVVESFNELENRRLDDFANALIQVENLVPVLPGNQPNGSNQPPLPMLYFCIPQNEKLLGYWDTVADRLYKIRHCLNIEGVARQMALFEPPIDPAALVKAVAGGADINAALADLSAPLPFYRFNVLMQKANELCSDVKSLGAALLAALEKKDAEALGLLRQSQEIRLLEAVKSVREQQIDEARENLAGIRKNKELATLRRDYYQNIEKINASETLQQTKLEEAFKAQQISQFINILASVAHIVPSFDVGGAGAGGSPRAGVSFGGPNVGTALQAAAAAASFVANAENYLANKASINAGQERRWDDWKLQERLANKELEQIESSIATAELRIAIAEKELDNQVIQIENARGTDAFMRSKYTNEELYQWQAGQISGVYFQSYKLAYDLAKQAERCFRFELGLQESSYITYGYWDSLKKGLLSADKLQFDLRRLEAAYLQQNRREYELTKHVSLVLLDPLALVKLRETGRCFFRLPEEIFDIDYPGHYFRRIKSVSLTLPCVVGPYTTISCTLRLLKNSIRINPAIGVDDYPRKSDENGLPADDERFVEHTIPIKAIAASSAQNDSGLFELSFRDERYLPFEGAGTISEWSLELFSDLPSNNPDPENPDFGKALRQFDYGTVSDAILHVKYSAREDAGAFKNGAVTHLREYFSQDDATHSLRMFNLRQELPTRWHRFLNPANPANGNIFELEMSPSLFPVRDAGKILKVNSLWILARCTNAGSYNVVATPPSGSATLTLAPLNQYGGMHFSQKDVSALGIEIVPTDPPVKWQLKMTRPGGGNLQEDPLKKVMEVEDLILVLGYEWN